jgi:hypothetical protein
MVMRFRPGENRAGAVFTRRKDIFGSLFAKKSEASAGDCHQSVSQL